MSAIANIQAKLDQVLTIVEGLLQGEPLRVIGYGAAVVIYLVARATGRIEDVSFEQAIAAALAAATVVVTVVETIRRYVYSPATVARIRAARRWG